MTTVEERNKRVYDQDYGDYLGSALTPAELRIVDLFQGRWHEIDMLDLGVGAGRTAFSFSALARSYVGIDYVPRMIDQCRARIPESDGVRFSVGDATDLSAFSRRRFDLATFSFNGIDCMSHESRLAVLRQVRRHIKNDGYFFFSSHCLDVFPFRLRLPSRENASFARWAYRCGRRIAWFAVQKRLNRRVDPDEAHARGWAILADGDHAFKSRYYYVSPTQQKCQLDAAGFELVAIYDRAGNTIDLPPTVDDDWLHYLCRPRRPAA